MPSIEKPSNKIFVAVTSSLILVGLSYIGRHWLPPAFKWFIFISSLAWNWFIALHAIPGWVILPLGFTGVWCVIRLSSTFRSPPQPAEPHWTDFTELKFLGVLWRWSYNQQGNIIHLVSFCPKVDCDMQVYAQLGRHYRAWAQASLYECDRCGHATEIENSPEAIENHVMREIQRLIRTKGWRNRIGIATPPH